MPSQEAINELLRDMWSEQVSAMVNRSADLHYFLSPDATYQYNYLAQFREEVKHDEAEGAQDDGEDW